MALYCNNDPENTSAADPLVDSDTGLREMSQAELKLMQDVTWGQMCEAGAYTRRILERVWQRLEKERCRRKSEIAELERMYFGR